jgi:preprotein translocase subunit SecD
MNIRENWRILLLVLIVIMSAVALFAPTGSGGVSASNTTGTTVNTSNTTNNASSSTPAIGEGPTNLEFGLELSGGTRVRASLVGLTAENVKFNPKNATAFENAVANKLGLSSQDVDVRVQSRKGGTVEVFDRNVSKAEFAHALQSLGKDVQKSDIRDGVTKQTRKAAVNVLDKKIKGAGLSGGDAAIATSATGGESYIIVEVPGKTPSQVTDLINEQGTVQIVAHFPVQKNNTTVYRNVPLFTQEGIADLRPVQQNGGESSVPITLTKEAAKDFAQAMRKFGFTSPQGIQSCRWQPQSNTSDTGYCLYTLVNGEIVNGTIVEGKIVSGAAMTGGRNGLAPVINNHEFVEDPSFVITTGNLSEAQHLLLNLRAGGLPTEISIETASFIRPSLAEKFKTYSLVTGLIALVAVGGVVAFRYREPRVALPMIVTAFSEVFILLGFAAAVGLALDLSHIAGFIAVIGTGVDDLVIIADEILQQGDVSTGRVFRSRFRKAFWVIGVAAATTIIAMLPLAVISFGDLQGFAIVTIAGVLIGVLITRPAYGDVLRNLVMD